MNVVLSRAQVDCPVSQVDCPVSQAVAVLILQCWKPGWACERLAVSHPEDWARHCRASVEDQGGHFLLHLVSSHPLLT